MSATRIALRPSVATPAEIQPGHASAILLKLDDRIIDDLKNAKERLQFVTGSTPKLRIGSHSIDLTLAPDTFRNELYASTSAASTADFTFRSVLSHRAEPKSNDAAGTDAALAKLQSTLASYEQEKQAKQANISNAVLPAPKNRFDAAKQQRQDRRRGLLGPAGSSHPGGSTNGSMAASSSNTALMSAMSEDEVRLKAMRIPIVHMLAIKPTVADTVKAKTHVPQSDLDNILTKVGKQVDGKWTLNDRAFKDLDVWQFNYPSPEDRQAAVDNAVRAYDRMRLGKDDRLWQMLLPVEDRDKGICLSRLHLGGAPASKAPAPQKSTSPVNGENPQEGKAPSMANTPRLGGSTPRPHNSTADLKKRLLSKNPQKARAAEDAKEKKRKEREVTAATGEKPKLKKPPITKKPEPKKVNTKFKSAEFVHSSEDESDEEGEVRETPSAPPPAPKATISKVSASANARAKTSSSDSSDVPLQQAIKATAKPRPSQTASSASLKPGTSPAIVAPRAPLPGKSTPKSTSKLSAPSVQPRGHQRTSSASKTDSRPTVPSPLGAARPRVASDISDRGAIGVQKPRTGTTEGPKGLGITNGVRKRHDTLTSHGDTTPSNGKAGIVKTEKPAIKPNPGALSKLVSKPSLTNGIKRDPDAGNLKRKADPVSQPDRSSAVIKHRKTESSASAPSGTITATIANGRGLGSALTPNTHYSQQDDVLFDTSTSSGSSSHGDVLDSITYGQGITLAEKFQDKYYPGYVELYDKLEAKRERGETPSHGELDTLWKMHRRLQQMKREINVASTREEGNSQVE